jgi:hypothetical protein
MSNWIQTPKLKALSEIFGNFYLKETVALILKIKEFKFRGVKVKI